MLHQNLQRHLLTNSCCKTRIFNKKDVPEARLAKEMEILKAQAMNEGKPEAIAEKIVQGRLGKFYSEICLVEQEFVKDPRYKSWKTCRKQRC